MSAEAAATLARPLSVEEEAELRGWLADDNPSTASIETVERLLATLDALRATPVANTAAIAKDDRYRIRQTSESISESFWHVARDYRITDRVAADEQVAICRALAAIVKGRPGPLRQADVVGAFGKFEVKGPPHGFARDLIARLERLDR